MKRHIVSLERLLLKEFNDEVVWYYALVLVTKEEEEADSNTIMLLHLNRFALFVAVLLIATPETCWNSLRNYLNSHCRNVKRYLDIYGHSVCLPSSWILPVCILMNIVNPA